ncbi:aminotransferase class V-fold PLP-dependent enzyme [bacterium]|nr:aminotransferase class V-fold PLP-dependent enzyme [bacterium]
MQKDLELFIQLTQELLEHENRKGAVEAIPSNELFEKIDLELRDEPTLDEEFTNQLRKLILNTPRTATELFFNQLFGGRIGKAVLGDLLAVMLNNSMYTYKVAGPQVGVEKEIIRNVSNLCGYGDAGVGTIAPGGSMSNLMAMIMGRDKYDPKSRIDGVNSKMTLYTSENSHYSIPKNAAFIGIGRKQVRYVKSDDKGRMIPEELDRMINEDLEAGHSPFFVNSTAGTTVLGAFDPIPEISKICKKHNIWLHVDGAYCGSVIFSHKYRHLVDGLHLSDSFSVNAHKMLGTPLTCSIILTKHRDCIYTSFSNEADYLYQTDEDDFNLGKTSLQCGRRNDALKLWTLWKSVGTKGLEEIVDQQFHLADVARDYIKSNPNYTLYSFEDSVSICFNYKDIPAQTLCTKLYQEAKLVVGYGQFKGQEFIRLVTVNSTNKDEDILNFFEILETYAKEELQELQA